MKSQNHQMSKEFTKRKWLVNADRHADNAKLTFTKCKGAYPLTTYIYISNVLTDHISNSLPQKTTKDIAMKISQCPFKNCFYRLPLSNRGIYLQIIHVRRKAIFPFYGTCIACVNNITFRIRHFT